MAQLPLFPPTPARCHATPEQVYDPADRRTHPYRVPIYHITLVRESFIETLKGFFHSRLKYPEEKPETLTEEEMLMRKT